MNLKFLHPRNWGLIKVIRDLENYRDWIKTIKREQANPKSNFHKFKLNRNYFYNVYLTISLTDADDQLTDNIKRLKIIDSLGDVHRYLDEELGFAECLVPEFNQYIDDRGNPTLTYVVMYRFAFNKFSIKWLFKWIFIIGLIWYFVAKNDLITKLWNLI